MDDSFDLIPAVQHAYQTGSPSWMMLDVAAPVVQAVANKIILIDRWRSPMNRTTPGGLYIPDDACTDTVAEIYSIAPNVDADAWGIAVGDAVFFCVDTGKVESFQVGDQWFVSITTDELIGVVKDYKPGIFD